LISAKAQGKHERAIASATATFAKKLAPAPPRSRETCMLFRPQRTHSVMTDVGSGDFSGSSLSAIGAIVSLANLSATSTSPVLRESEAA
jgi:hypothetical protein